MSSSTARTTLRTRYLINDVAVKHNLPWVYGACVGTEGRAMAIVPRQTACLRCVFPQPPGPGELPTCDTAGVLAAVASIVASIQVTMAMKLLLGVNSETQLVRVDGWSPRFHVTQTRDAQRADCPTCAKRQFEFLERSASSGNTRLCGRNAVQVRPDSRFEVSLDQLARKIGTSVNVQRTAVLAAPARRWDRDLDLSGWPGHRAGHE
jgi:adenylyltransferase/sulfurtransferase